MENKGKKGYTHITYAERKEIRYYLDKKYSHAKIAALLSRSKNSISYEVKKNSVNGYYDPKKANGKARNKRKNSKYQGMKVTEDKELWDYVIDKIKRHWSPENISDRIRNVDKQMKYVSAKGVYKFIYGIYGGTLPRFLFYKGKKRKPKENKPSEKLQDRIFIDQRSKSIDKRRFFGDWEGDFIISNRNSKYILLVLYERKSGYFILKKFPNKTMEPIYRFIYETTGGVIMNSLTLDNDIVFRKHKELSQLLGKPIYFCHPYHSWEKGGVENINKLIRRFIPKGDNIGKYSDEEIKKIQNIFDNKPRKKLEGKTPYEVMLGNNQFIDNKKITIGDIIKVEDGLKIKTAERPT